MEPAAITDPDDPRVDDYRRLHDARVRRLMERPDDGRPGFFVAEGAHALGRLLASGRRVRSVLVDQIRLEALAGMLEGLEAPLLVADQPTLRAVAGFPVHRGVLAAADRWVLPDPAEVLAGRRIAILEDINDHENLGVIFRNAGSLGVDGVLLSPRCCDPLYRRSVRVSMGHVLAVPWTRLEPWPGGLEGVRAAGFSLVALTPAAHTEPLPGWSPAPGERVAVLLGAEGPGLSPAALAASQRRLTIPMRQAEDSLNVASAAAIAFYALTSADASAGSIAPEASTSS